MRPDSVPIRRFTPGRRGTGDNDVSLNFVQLYPDLIGNVILSHKYHTSTFHSPSLISLLFWK